MKNIIQILVTLFCLTILSNSTKAQSLEYFLEKAYANNPELKALQLEYESALEKGKQVSQ